MLKKHIFISLFCICSFVGSAQELWEPAQKQELIASYKNIFDWFTATQSYAFRMKYNSYKDHTTKALKESSEGYYKRSGNNYKTEAIGVKTVQNQSMRIIIDTAEQVVTLANTGNLSPAMSDVSDMEKMLDRVKALKKRKSGKGVSYRIEFRPNELYDAYEFTVNEKGLMESMVYYYSGIQDENDGSGNYKGTKAKVKPRMEILFMQYESPAKISSSEFQEKGVAENASGKISLSGSYKTFQLKDYRTKDNK